MMTLKFRYQTKEEVPRLAGEKQRLEAAAQMRLQRGDPVLAARLAASA